MTCTPNPRNNSHIPELCVFSTISNDDSSTKIFLSGTDGSTAIKIAIGIPGLIDRSTALSGYAPLDIGEKNGGLALIQWVKAKDNINHPADSHLSSFLQQNTTFEARRCLLYVGVRVISARVDGGSYSETVLKDIAHAEGNTTSVFATGIPGFQFHLEGDDASYGVRAALTLPQENRRMLSSEIYDIIGDPSIVNVTQGAATEGPAVARMLFATDNTTQSLEHMAQHLNVALRANDTVLLQQRTGDTTAIASSQAVNGTVWVQEIFVDVRWQFLILPAMVLVLTAVFLVITIVKSRPKGIGLWKSNPLTLLWHADHQSPGSEFGVHGRTATSNELESAATRMQVDIVMKEDFCHVARIVDRVKA